MKRRGFTLIELLVVIAIIAILAAILFPVFAQAKVAAKKAADSSNVKQIVIGSIMYLTDYDDAFPYSMGWAKHNCDGWGGDGDSWFDSVAPYIKNLDLFITPNDPRPKAYSSFVLGGLPNTKYTLTSYAPNYLLMGWPHANQNQISATWDRGRTVDNMSGVDRPANTVMIQLNMQTGSWPCWMSVQVPNSGTWFSNRQHFYAKGANFGVTDGHVEFKRTPEVGFHTRTLGSLSHYPFGVN